MNRGEPLAPLEGSCFSVIDNVSQADIRRVRLTISWCSQQERHR